MKHLLFLLLIPVPLLGQGTWKLVRTPPGLILQCDFFEGDKGYVITRRDSSYGPVFTGVSFDTIYYTEDGGRNWDVFFTNSASSIPSAIANIRYNFISATDWCYITSTENDELLGAREDKYLSIYINLSPVYLASLPTIPSQGIPNRRWTIHISEDSNIYCEDESSSPTREKIYHWIFDSSKWENVFPKYQYAHAISLNRKSKDCFALLADSVNQYTFFIPGFDLSKMQVATVPFGLPKHVRGTTWISSSGKYVSVTFDNGLSWSPTDSLDGYISDIQISSSGHGYAITPASLYRTTNDGLTWKPLVQKTAPFFTNLSVVDSQIAYIVQGWRLFKTTDGGGSVFLDVKEQTTLLQGITVQPNPVIGSSCTLRFPPLQFAQSVRLYDMLGRVIIDKLLPQGAEEFVLDMQHRAPGNFLVALQGNSTLLIRQ